MHRDPTSADRAELPDPEQLPGDVATLRQMVVELVASLRASQAENVSLRQRLDTLLRRVYGPRSERYAPGQGLLFAEGGEATDPAPDVPVASTSTAGPRRRARPHGRRRLPTNLPHEPRHHVLPEAARRCGHCGQVRMDIGVDRSAQLEYRPAALFVVEHFVHKYVCPCCRPGATPAGPPEAAREAVPMTVPLSSPAPEPRPGAASPAPQEPAAEPAAAPSPLEPGAASDEVVQAAVKPALPIAKGLPGPGLLAHLIVSKYVDHLPLYRLERIYERQGVFLARSTLCDWLGACAALLQPLYRRLVEVVLASRALHTDDTPVNLQDPRTHQLSLARFWVYLGDALHPYTVFDFTRTRQRDGPRDFLADFQGYLHADAFGDYDGLYLPDPGSGAARIVEVACNAHARRKFYEARASAALEAHQALAYYRQLYELEGSARRLDFDEEQRRRLRQDFAVPILTQFQHWLEAQRVGVLPKSPLGQAVGYALRNWSALVRYTEAGFLDIDNNVAEREMKRVAIGRKNWLFVGSEKGGQTAAVLLSFTATCQRLGVEPWAYLQDVLTRLPAPPVGPLGDLLPDHWQATRRAEATPPAVPATDSAAPATTPTS
jgi:transposase